MNAVHLGTLMVFDVVLASEAPVLTSAAVSNKSYKFDSTIFLVSSFPST